MSYERYTELIQQMCEVTGLADSQTVLQTRTMDVDGFTTWFDHVQEDPDAMYLQFDFGAPTAGRTLTLYRMMLESNLLVYAQDQAQMGLNPDNGCVLLIVRIVMSPDIDGQWMAETLTHYAEHGKYWRDNMMKSSDEMFEGISSGEYLWLRA
jgi:hypothetical protein